MYLVGQAGCISWASSARSSPIKKICCSRSDPLLLFCREQLVSVVAANKMKKYRKKTGCELSIVFVARF